MGRLGARFPDILDADPDARIATQLTAPLIPWSRSASEAGPAARDS
jgi:hypothetical protein